MAQREIAKSLDILSQEITVKTIELRDMIKELEKYYPGNEIIITVNREKAVMEQTIKAINEGFDQQ